MQRTLALIKPDAMKNGHMIDILKFVTDHGLVIADLMKGTWNRTLLAQFYAEHQERDFFVDLLDFMSSGPMVAMTLVGDNAVERWRFLMGATDPKKAAPGTVRNLWGSKTGPIMWNCVHGSDSQDSATRETEIIRIATMPRRERYGRISGFGDEAMHLLKKQEEIRTREHDRTPER